MGLTGLALYGIILSFFGTICGLLIDCTINISQQILAQGWLSDFEFLTPGGMVGHAKILEEVFFTTGFNVLGLIFSLAWVIYAIALITQLFRLFGDPGSGGKTPAVGSTLLKFAFYAFLLASCYPLLEMILKWYSQLISGIAGAGNDMIQNADWQTLGSSFFSNFTDPQWYVFFCILAFGVGTSMIGCMLTYMERYIAMAIYVYLAPLCIAMGANDETADVFKKWLMGLIGQMLALALSIILMGAAYHALSHGVTDSELNSVQGDSLKLTADMGVRSMRIIMCIILLGASKNSERFFNMLGFSTMNYGDAARTFALGLTKAAMAARVAGSAATTGEDKLKKAMNHPPKVENNQVKTDGFSKKDTRDAVKDANAAGKTLSDNVNSKKNNAGFVKEAGEKAATVNKAAEEKNKAEAALKQNHAKEEQRAAKLTNAEKALDSKYGDVSDAGHDLREAKTDLAQKEAAKEAAEAKFKAADEALKASPNDETKKAAMEAAKGERDKANSAVEDAKGEVDAKQQALNNAIERHAGDNGTRAYSTLEAYKNAHAAYERAQDATQKAQANYDEKSAAYNEAAGQARNFVRENGKEFTKDLPHLSNQEISALVGDMDNRHSYEQKGWAFSENGGVGMVVDIKDPNNMNRTIDRAVLEMPGSTGLGNAKPGSAMIDLGTGEVVGYTGSSGGAEKTVSGLNYVNLSDNQPRDYVPQSGENFSSAQTRFDQTKNDNAIAMDSGGINGMAALLGASFENISSGDDDDRSIQMEGDKEDLTKKMPN